MDVIISRLVQEDLKVTDNGVRSLPALTYTARLGDLDPALTGRPHPMVDVYTEWQLGWIQRGQRMKEKGWELQSDDCRDRGRMIMRVRVTVWGEGVEMGR